MPSTTDQDQFTPAEEEEVRPLVPIASVLKIVEGRFRILLLYLEAPSLRPISQHKVVPFTLDVIDLCVPGEMHEC
jgi:hypothetical protein